MGIGDILILTAIAAAAVLIIKDLSGNRSRCGGECAGCRKSCSRK